MHDVNILTNFSCIVPFISFCVWCTKSTVYLKIMGRMYVCVNVNTHKCGNIIIPKTVMQVLGVSLLGASWREK